MPVVLLVAIIGIVSSLYFMPVGHKSTFVRKSRGMRRTCKMIPSISSSDQRSWFGCMLCACHWWACVFACAQALISFSSCCDIIGRSPEKDDGYGDPGKFHAAQKDTQARNIHQRINRRKIRLREVRFYGDALVLFLVISLPSFNQCFDPPVLLSRRESRCDRRSCST